MDSSNCAEYIWELENFISDNKGKSSQVFNSKNNEQFYLYLYAENKISDFAVIHVCQNSPYKNIHVQCTISALKQNNEKCLTDVSLLIFNGNTSVKGGLYLIKRAYISNSENALLTDGKLRIQCELKVLDNDSIGQSEIQTESMKALGDYESLLESCKHSDVVFVVGKKEFKLHKAILSARSPVFAAMFDSDLSENKQNRVDIPDVDAEVFEELVRFIYTGKLPSSDQYALELFFASDKYQFDSIKALCERSLGENLSIETLANVLTLADMHSASELKSKCAEFFTKNAAKVMKTEAWKEMAKTKHDLVLELLQELATKAEPLLK